MAIINPISIIYVETTVPPDFSDHTPIVAEVWCRDTDDLPNPVEFGRYILMTGSKALLPDGTEYRLRTSSIGSYRWFLQDKSPFSNVYTKTEVDTITDAIAADVSQLQTDVGDLQTSDSNQDAYIFALIGRSALNYLPDTVWEGATTAGSGYICQDLAISLPAGDYIWKMKRDGNTSTSFVLKAADNSELYRVNRGAGVNDITQTFTISAAAAKISIYAGYSIQYSDNMIFKDLA